MFLLSFIDTHYILQICLIVGSTSNILNKQGIISKFCIQYCSNFSELTYNICSTIGFLLISYFIVAQCTFTTNFSIKLKSQFQDIFGQDSFLLTMNPFQSSLSQNSTNCLFFNGQWNVSSYHYSFNTNISHLFLQALGLS